MENTKKYTEKLNSILDNETKTLSNDMILEFQLEDLANKIKNERNFKHRSVYLFQSDV